MESCTAVFDIFRLQPDGSEVHAGEATSYTGALQDIELLASRKPARYIIHDRETGQRNIVNLSALTPD
jgi:hypothetical protein